MGRGQCWQPAGLRQELFIAERDRCGGVARGGVVPIEVLRVVVRIGGTCIRPEDGVVALRGDGGGGTLEGIGRSVANEVAEVCYAEGRCHGQRCAGSHERSI